MRFLGGFKIGQLEIFKCEKCGFRFEQDHLNFYLNLETGQIEEYMMLFSTVHLDDNSPISGNVYKTYCGNCNKYIKNYEIVSYDERYDKEAAYLLLRLLIPKKIDFFDNKIKLYEIMEEDIKNINTDYLIDFYKSNAIYLEEIDELIYDLEDIKDVDIGDCINRVKEELELFEKTVHTISYCNADYNMSLNGEKLAKDICPDCQSEISPIDEENPCPKCGGKMYICECLMLD